MTFFLRSESVCMKAFRLLFVVMLLGFAATMARADVIDPQITVGGGGSCASQSLTGLTESFTGLTTGCMIDFTNNISGTTLFEIVVNITSPFIGPLSCIIGSGSPFTNGFVSSPTSCTFTAPVDDDDDHVVDGGLPPGGIFSLTFDTNFGSAVDTTISQNVISTPEPASALLLLTGVGALAAFQKRR